MGIQKVIPSAGRADRVLTMKQVPDAVLCVPESERDQYHKWNPSAEIVPHPDSIQGISPKRQWIYEQFGDVFMVDDDCIGAFRIYVPKDSPKPYQIEDPDLIDELVQQQYEICKERGMSLFGFEKTQHPAVFSGHYAFELNFPIMAGAFGILEDRNLYFPDDPNFIAEDYWINCLNAYYNRASWVDMRFSFGFKDSFHNPGGVAKFRNDENAKNSLKFLEKNFGSDVIHILNKSDYDKNNKVKKSHTRWEMELKMPF